MNFVAVHFGSVGVVGADNDVLFGVGLTTVPLSTDLRRTLKGAFFGCFNNKFNKISPGTFLRFELIGCLPMLMEPKVTHLEMMALLNTMKEVSMLSYLYPRNCLETNLVLVVISTASKVDLLSYGDYGHQNYSFA